MLTLGFKQCKSNTGVYYFIDEKTRELVIAIVYVDNVCFMGSEDFLLLLELKPKFMTKYECHNLGETKEFLGMCINITTNLTSTLLPLGCMFKPNDKQCNFNFHQKYQQMVESLMYLMIGSCPNIGFAVVKLA